MKKEPNRKRLPNTIRWILWVLLVQFLLFNISASLYAYRFTHFYTGIEPHAYQENENVFSKTWRLFSGSKIPRSFIEEFPTFPCQSIRLIPDNGNMLEGWYAAADSNSKGTVILFHGVTVNKGTLINEAGEFRHLGYNVFLLDFRGHGNSGGNSTTLGIRESQDVVRAYNYIRSRGEKRIILWGSSMGAVAIARAVGNKMLEPSAIILEMPFASLKDHLQARARMSGFSGFPEKPFAFFVNLWMGIENGFNGFRHKTTDYVKNIKCPVLLQWGALDSSVPEEETNRIFNSIGTPEKRLVVYPTAAHESMIQKDPMKWGIETKRFLDNLH